MLPVASSRPGNVAHPASAKLHAIAPAISDFRAMAAPLDSHEALCGFVGPGAFYAGNHNVCNEASPVSHGIGAGAQCRAMGLHMRHSMAQFGRARKSNRNR